MTDTQAIEKLRELQLSNDYEYSHQKADEILCSVLESAGRMDVVTEWKKVRKEYS